MNGPGFSLRTWTSVDGLVLSARDYAGAQGPARLPVVCLHGLTRNARDFEALAPAVAATGRRVLAPDMRGRGRSAWSADAASYTVPTYAADVAALAAAAGIARAVFVGTSMGGLITLALASLEAPALVAAAVLNDIGPEFAPAGLARIMGYAGVPVSVATWEEAAAYARRVNGDAFPHYGEADWERFARRLFREEAGRPTPDYDPAIAAALRPPPSTSGSSSSPAPAARDPWASFDALAAGRRLMLVRGATSDLLSPETAGRMRRHAPHMAFVEAPGVGHAPMLDEPEVAPALMEFLAATD